MQLHAQAQIDSTKKQYDSKKIATIVKIITNIAIRIYGRQTDFFFPNSSSMKIN
jgi:hypothetical protein